MILDKNDPCEYTCVCFMHVILQKGPLDEHRQTIVMILDKNDPCEYTCVCFMHVILQKGPLDEHFKVLLNAAIISHAYYMHK